MARELSTPYLLVRDLIHFFSLVLTTLLHFIFCKSRFPIRLDVSLGKQVLLILSAQHLTHKVLTHKVITHDCYINSTLKQMGLYSFLERIRKHFLSMLCSKEWTETGRGVGNDLLQLPLALHSNRASVTFTANWLW